MPTARHVTEVVLNKIALNELGLKNTKLIHGIIKKKKNKTAINLGMFNYAIKPYHFMFNLMIIILLTIKGLPCNVSDTV